MGGVGLWLLTSAAPVVAFRGVPPCPPARYVVQDQPILSGPAIAEVDALVLTATRIAIESGCPPATLRLHGTPRGTLVRATFRHCVGIRGRARLRGRIDLACTTLRGTFVAKKAKVRRTFIASSLATCGDGIWQPALEQCDAGSGCATGLRCTGACRCEPDAGTTSTTGTTTSGGSTSTTLAGPDLRPTTFTAPGTADADASIPVDWTIENPGGTALSAPWTDAIYLSTDGLLDAADLELATFPRTTSLGAGQSYGRTGATVHLPELPAGGYVLLLAADAHTVQPESDERNNLLASPLTLHTPDLTPTMLSAPGTAGTGERLAISWTVANQGTGPLRAVWSDIVFLSTDTVLDAGDRSLGAVARTVDLAAGASYTPPALTVTVPNVAPGTYTLILKTDGTGQRFEEDEGNNTRTAPLTVHAPNLTPTDLTVPAAADVGSTIMVSWTVANTGGSDAAAPWVDALFLSQDGAIGTGDRLLGTFAHGGEIAAAATYTTTQPLLLPSLPGGDYFLLVRTDNGSALFETDDSDNTRAASLTLRTPDLVPIVVTGPGSTPRDQPFVVSWTVENQGGGAAVPPWTDRIYLSADTLLRAGDRLLSTETRTDALAPGGRYDTSNVSVTIPGVVTPGSYFLIVQTDDANGVYEASDVNNARAVPLTVTP